MRVASVFSGLGVIGVCALASTAHADGVAVKLDLIKSGEIKLDGIPKEWSTAMTPLSRAVSGAAAGSELSVRAAVAYDDANVYISADVNDDKLVRTASCADAEDHASLLVAFPTTTGGYAVEELGLYAGDPGKTAGCVKIHGGAVSGARIVEAPKLTPGGYTFEAIVPWSAFREAARTRVGLRGALRYYDNDGAGVRSVVGTSTEAAPADLPRLPGEAEQALDDGLLHEKAITAGPLYDKLADVAGDGLYERVLVYDRYLVVLGPHFRDGKEYYFNDLTLDTAAGQLVSFEVKDLNGDAKADIVLRKRAGTREQFRETLQVLNMGASETPFPMFNHEVGISSPTGHVTNEVRFVPDGAKLSIEISPGTVSGYTAATYNEAVETSMDPLLLPWGTIKSQTYGWNGSTFAKTHEEAQAGQAVASSPGPRAPAAAAQAPAPAPPRPPTADEIQDQVLALYRKERHVSATEKPRFDFAVDVAEDARAERVVVHGRDLVVIGKGFKGGTGFAYISLQQFSEGKDVSDVTARDLTGDGRAEIIVRGVAHAPGPKEAGKPVTVDRELLLVYGVADGTLTRVFAAETARAIADKRVQGALAFVPGARGTEIQLMPGRAFGFTDKTYPFGQDPSPVAGLEPLLLPWSGAAPARYRWTGTAFAK